MEMENPPDSWDPNQLSGWSLWTSLTQCCQRCSACPKKVINLKALASKNLYFGLWDKVTMGIWEHFPVWAYLILSLIRMKCTCLTTVFVIAAYSFCSFFSVLLFTCLHIFFSRFFCLIFQVNYILAWQGSLWSLPANLHPCPDLQLRQCSGSHLGLGSIFIKGRTWKVRDMI